ncbi:MAG TPA: FGGY family carbohydrate kinase [Marinagarivorans sp.]
MYFLGIDIGSSSVKVSVFNGDSGLTIAATHYPKLEMEIASPQPGWAEQSPEFWWQCVKDACGELFTQKAIDPSAIQAIGITYQMHGLVCVDKAQQVLRPSIIWCDSRAVQLGNEALNELGESYCFEQLLNSPGNFTAAKLRWVQLNEPELFAKIHKIMLPGDYIAMRLSGDITTTATGLSEGMLWNHKAQQPEQGLLQLWGMSASLIPELVPAIGEQVSVSASCAEELGLKPGTPVCYRCGDQPNNAFSLNVLNPGDVAATAGTSGVIYSVTDKAIGDRKHRVNTFQHVTHNEQAPRNGILACVNGAGRSFSWLREILSAAGNTVDYGTLNDAASKTPIGSNGLNFMPFGNGAERIFNNAVLGGGLVDIDFNRHSLGHIVRATQEGIVFALKAGFEVIESLGGASKVIRAPSSSLFLSPLFQYAFCNTTQCTLELLTTDSVEGAARGAALGHGFFKNEKETFQSIKRADIFEPEPNAMEQYADAYARWKKHLSQTV